MFVTLVLLSIAGVNNETPETKTPIVQCFDTFRRSAKHESVEPTTKKCVLKKSKPMKRVEK